MSLCLLMSRRVGDMAGQMLHHDVKCCDTQPLPHIQYTTPASTATVSPSIRLKAISHLVRHKTTTCDFSRKCHAPLDQSFHKTHVLRCCIELIQMSRRQSHTIVPKPGTPQRRRVSSSSSAFVVVRKCCHLHSLSSAYIVMLGNTYSRQ
jgi:hypothetical protein